MLRRACLAVLALTSFASTSWAQDTDLDGVADASDAFPCDSTVSAAAYAPGQDVHGMILVEDQWPAAGDYDTNDLVATYNYAFELDAIGRTHRLRLTLNVLAIGGVFDNGAGLRMPIPVGSVGSVTVSVDGGPASSVTPSVSDADLTVILQQNLRNLFGGAAGQINSRSDLARVAGARVVVEIALSTPVTIAPSDAPFDLFLFRSADPSHEIHQPRYDGTSAMNGGLFGTLDDGSTPGRRFVDRRGVPAVLLLPQSTAYPKEGQPITALFPDIASFAASGGVSNADFYTSQVVTGAQFVDVNGLGAPTPTMVSVTVDRACITQADLDGDGFIAALDCNDQDPLMFPGNPEVCDGRDNDCNMQVDDGVTGSFLTYYRDNDGDGFGDLSAPISACGQPPGYVLGNGGCVNGSTTDCNRPGKTLIASSAYVDNSPPSGWRQCAGFINTTGTDIAGGFMDDCLDHTGLRVIVKNLSTGQVEEDVYSTNLSRHSSWPSWNYLGGSLTAAARTYWGTTTYFTTTDGRDACGHNVSPSGQATFGSGNGSRAIIVPGTTGANEYRVNCSGQSLTNRSIAVYVADASSGAPTPDCDDADPNNFPTNTEVCDTQDNNCDGQTDEGLTQTYYRDADGDGFGLASDSVVACAAPSGYVVGGTACINGSVADCNAPGTTLIPSSAYVDPSPPSGWAQCAGFTNTTGDDVSANFMAGCLGTTSLRVVVKNANGQVEEDVYSTNLSNHSSWPSWNYLGGSLSAAARTYWGTTTFFTTTDGRDACGHNVSPSGQPTFGSGNGSRAIIVGGATGAGEYRVNCSGQTLVGRSVAVFTQRSGPTTSFDCNDGSASTYPGATEICNGADDDCDTVADENNPGGNVSCTTGLAGACSAGATQCTGGALMCVAVNGSSVDICGDNIDNDCNGQIDEPMCVNVSCSNGGGGDCNPAGSTLIGSSAYFDLNPPAGWTQCAGFVNTTGTDVSGSFMSNCLGSSRLRVIVTNLSTGQVEEDVYSQNLNAYSAWPSWNYLGGSLTAAARTSWGTTTFFTTTDGRDACGHSVSPSGQPTFGSGNGSRAIIAGGASGAGEYRVNCSGATLTNRQIGVYR